MANKVTLAQVDQLVVQLTSQEQIKLIAYISERLSKMRLPDDQSKQNYASRIEAFLKMSDEMAADTVGDVDSAQDIRQIREERTSGL